jgi:hypothetical protein
MSPHTTTALVYDFDGTLSPKPMQDYTILPAIGLRTSTCCGNASRRCLRMSRYLKS